MSLRLSLRIPASDVEPYKVFDRRGGFIGRESACDWVLPDPDKVISRRHLEIRYTDGQYWFIDISANGTFINDQDEPVARNKAIDARSVAVLSLGHYCVDVLVEHAEVAGQTSQPLSAPSPAPNIPGGTIPPNWDLADPGSEGAAFDDSWPNGTPSPSPAAAHQTPRMSQARPTVQPAAHRGGQFPVGRPVPEPADGLLTAFLSGAGLAPRDVGDADPAEVMRQAGASLRMMAAGLHGLLAARAALKHEMHIDRTTLSRNPLKTAADPAAAVRSLLKPPARNGMSAEDAVAEVLADLETHEIAMTAGMNAALGALLDRFAPQRLAQGLDRSSLLENLLPAARRSRYWQAYEEQYRDIIDEAECNFHQLFGEEFARAYLDTARPGAHAPRRRTP